LLGVATLLAGCFETLPKQLASADLPFLPTLRDRNAVVAEAWDRASLECRAQHKPRGGFCEQLKSEGEFLACSSERFASAASALRYHAVDKIWVWRNCVATTANLLRDGYYLSRNQIERRMAACQARLDPEPEYAVRQSGLLSPFVAMLATGDKIPLPAVVPNDFGLNEPQIALPTCAARFSPLTESKPDVRAVAMALPPTVPPEPAPPPPAPVIVEVPAPRAVLPAAEQETKEVAKPPARPRARTAVGTKDVKPTANTSPASRTAVPISPASRTPLTVGACPIPGACGPTVPVDAVGKP